MPPKFARGTTPSAATRALLGDDDDDDDDDAYVFCSSVLRFLIDLAVLGFYHRGALSSPRVIRA